MTMTNHSINPLKLFVSAFVAVATILLALVVAAQPAYATFKGANGLIAFESNQLTQNPEGDKEIFVMKPDGTGLTNLTNNNVPDTAPAWSPDGQRIAFVSFRDNGSGEIYTMDADGHYQTPLTNNPTASDNDPTWSPDGTQIAWSSNGDIWIMNADGSGVPSRLTSGAEHDSAPAWSPDGSHIAFAGSRPTSDSQGSEIYVIRPDGTGLTNLSKAPGDDGQPNWSPDGSQIAVQSNRDGNFHIYKMNSDGSNQTRLTNNPHNPWHSNVYDFAPSWSPDGTKIVFEANRTMSNGMFLNNEIYVMDAMDRDGDGNGDNQTNLTNTEDGIRNFTPDWQPVDNTGPAAVGNFAANPGDREISLSWANPMDPDFAATRILRSTVGFATGPDPTTEQVQVYEGTASSHIDAGLVNGTTYYYTAFARDSAGNWSTAATTSAAPVPSDASPPITTATASPTPNEAGWHKPNVTLTFTGDDGQNGSGIKETYYRIGTSGEYKLYDANYKPSISSEGITEISYYSTDNAGNSEQPKTFTVKLDKTAPTIDGTDVNDTTWRNGPLSQSFTASDGLSGLAPNQGLNADGSFTLTASAESTKNANGDIVPTTVSKTVTDMAGNTSAPRSLSALVDLTKPTLNPTVSPNPVLLNGSATASAGANDALSGVDSSGCGSVSTSSVGSKSVSCSATDKAGNSANANASYSVIYDWTGFFQPVDNKDANGNYVLNKAKAGNTIPLKFSLGGDQGVNILAVGSPSSGSITCSSTATTDSIEEYSTATTSGLKYDPVANQYIYNWKTESTWAGKCRQLVVRLVDGTEHRASFQFVK